MKITLFDFCETLANFQTADEYIRFVQSHSPTSNTHIKKIYEFMKKYKLLSIPRRLFPRFSLDKKCLLLQLKGRSIEEMEYLAYEYYKQRIKTSLISEVVEELKGKKSEGYKVYLVSGGYSIYLKYFAEEFCIDGVIASTIDFERGVCKGRLLGPDCMYDNKIAYIKQRIPDNHYDEWYAYSDSYTDLPMLKMVGHPIVISKEGCSQIWAEKRGYKQIIWK